MILKPFMLRRCKADVENEMAKKVHIVAMGLYGCHGLQLVTCCVYVVMPTDSDTIDV